MPAPACRDMSCGERAKMRAVRDTAWPAPARAHAGCASRAHVSRHSRITSHNRAWAQKQDTRLSRPDRFAPHSWRIVFVADDLNCHYADRARVAKALAWMLSLTLPRRAERQDRERVKVLLCRAPVIPTGRYRVPGIVAGEGEFA